MTVLRSRFVRIVRSVTAIVIACNDCLGIIINRSRIYEAKVTLSLSMKDEIDEAEARNVLPRRKRSRNESLPRFLRSRISLDK